MRSFFRSKIVAIFDEAQRAWTGELHNEEMTQENKDIQPQAEPYIVKSHDIHIDADYALGCVPKVEIKGRLFNLNHKWTKKIS